MSNNWIPLRQIEGTASRQAHVRLPEGTYEREISKEGFFGPAAFFHHKNPPTGWIDFKGPLRPRAFDRWAIISSVSRLERMRSALTAFERIASPPWSTAYCRLRNSVAALGRP